MSTNHGATSLPKICSRPNTELSHAERQAKRQLKKILKQQTRIRKYETRLQQATTRGDEVTAARARKELEDYCNLLSQDPNSVVHEHGFKRNSRTRKDEESPAIDKGRRWMLKIWNKLILQIKDPETTKQNQTDHARELLQNMTKGTQTESMFDNDQALLGYTRQKFMERALLAFKSLDQVKKYPDFFNILMRTRQSLHIGCGPGCDALGVLAFLKHCDEDAILDRIVLMDYVMPKWKSLVIDSLIPLISPKHVIRVDTASADVRSPFQNGMNRTFCNSMDFSQVNLVVVSYLLTETRGKWQDFFRDLFQKIKPRTLMLLCEPTAWQIHLLIKEYRDHIERYQWLDSSQNAPELQVLEGRMGPAVLMIYTK
jgi:hypothetical protein